MKPTCRFSHSLFCMLCSLVVGSVLLLVQQQVAEDSDGEPSRANLPNIVFMMADDLGYADVGYQGGKSDTPNIDDMARSPHSIHLRRYYSGGHVCSPTRGTVLTGRHNNRYCIMHAIHYGGCNDFGCQTMMPLPTSEITVAEILKVHGYKTAVFGKWHVGELPPCPLPHSHPKWPIAHPGVHGFDTWWVTPGAVATVDPNCGGRASIWQNYHTLDSDTGLLKPYPDAIKGDDSLFIAQLFHQFLDHEVVSGKPFFAYLAFHSPHSPFFATPHLKQKYMSRGYKRHQADYYGSIELLDEAVGKIRQLLDEYGIRNNTMLWFTSDNGPQLGQPGTTGGLRGRKGSIYEGGIRVPGIIEWPDQIRKNHVSEFPVVSSDLLPTACDIVGTNPPTDRPIDGISIMPLIRGETELRNRSIGWSINLHGRGLTYQVALSGNKYKLYATYESQPDCLKNIALFDLVNDRNESRDLSAKHVDIVQLMKVEALDWIRSVIHSAQKEVQCTGYSKWEINCHRCRSREYPYCDPKS